MYQWKHNLKIKQKQRSYNLYEPSKKKKRKKKKKRERKKLTKNFFLYGQLDFLKLLPCEWQKKCCRASFATRMNNVTLTDLTCPVLWGAAQVWMRSQECAPRLFFRPRTPASWGCPASGTPDPAASCPAHPSAVPPGRATGPMPWLGIPSLEGCSPWCFAWYPELVNYSEEVGRFVMKCTKQWTGCCCAESKFPERWVR